jgi:molybdenum cofactor biosynthesis protein B
MPYSAFDISNQVILITGGTGVAPRDQTPETIERLFTKSLSGFGELFRMLSYQEIGPAAMLSRACAGLIDRTAVFLMPGSTAAVRLAMERLILPELGHLAKLATKQV